jgi:hypothetical protein
LDQTRSATTAPEMDAMRRRAWHEQGIAALSISEISNDWLRQAVMNEAVRRWGPRGNEGDHGR